MICNVGNNVMFKSPYLSCMCIMLLIGSGNFVEDKIETLSYYGDLVIEGTVQETSLDSIYRVPGANSSWMTNLLVIVDTVHPSYYSFNSIEISIPGGRIEGRGDMCAVGHYFDINVGEKVILFAAHNNTFNRYITYQHGEYIVKDEIIYCPSVRIKEAAYDASSIQEIIKVNVEKRKIGKLVEESNIVAKGKLMRYNNGVCDFAIEKVYKGNVRDDIIQITRLPIGEEECLSPRPAFLARDWDIGTTHIMFLKRIDDLYYPFAGSNSSIKVEGDSISRNKIRLRYGLKELENQIKMAARK